jgi:hypothetical protein
LEDRTEPASVYQIKAYQPGVFYYGLPDYVGSTNYIELDREVSTFHLNNIKNGLFPSMLLSFNNGVPSDDERRAIERHVNEKFSGSSATPGACSFRSTTAATPRHNSPPVNPNDNDGMYEFLATECTTKILAGHRITSPLLFGIRGEGNGFGNNADELRDSFSLFQNSVIQPFQRTLLEGLEPLFGVNGIDLDFYFKTLKPADFIDVDAVKAQTTDEQEKEGVEAVPGAEGIEPAIVDTEVAEGAAEAEASYNGAQISAALDILVKVKEGILSPSQAILFLIQFLQFEEADARALFAGQTGLSFEGSLQTPDSAADALIALGEDEDDDYQLIDEREVDYDSEEARDALWAFARVPSSNPAGKSEQDGNIIKVRYKYAPDVAEEQHPRVLPQDDTGRQGLQEGGYHGRLGRAVNPGWGPRGADTYDIWLKYKGGGSCQHFWQRRTYLKKNNKRISVNQAKKLIQEAGPMEPRLPHERPKGGAAPARYDQPRIP